MTKGSRRRPHDTKPNVGESEQHVLLESMGYAKNMRNLREELKWEMDLLRNEIKDSMRSCLDDTKEIMKEVLEKTRRVEEAQSGDALKTYFQTAREDMRIGLEHLARLFEEQISENTSHVLSDVGALRQHQEDTEQALFEEIAKVHTGASNLENLVSHSVGQITELLNDQQATSSENFTDIRLMSQDTSKYGEVLTTNLESHLKRHLQQQSVNVDFTEVFRVLDKSQRNTSNDIKMLGSELAKIQQELNLDFPVELLNQGGAADAGQSVHKQMQLPGSVEAANMLPLGDQPSKAPMGHAQTIGTAQHTPTGAESSQVGDTFSRRRTRKSVKRRSENNAESAPFRIRRVRHYWSQTDGGELTEQSCQTEVQKHKKTARVMRAVGVARKTIGLGAGGVASIEPMTARKAKPMISDVEALKKQARENLIKPQYNVFDYYWEYGCFQRIAKSALFQNLTFVIIFLNSIWIGIDLDNNDATVLTEAHPIFFIAENAFCLFFFSEVCIRFMAFRKKKYCFRDAWFLFDVLLVGLMVVETWIIVAVMKILGMTKASDLGPVSILRVARMAKMARMARMVRLVRMFPELIVLIKGIKAAVRSVMVFFMLWMLIIYIYAVILRQATEEAEIGKRYFRSVPAAMNTLLLRGILPEFADFMDDVGDEIPVLWPILMSFILLASITMMNMLIGVLVEVVSVLSAVEKESATVTRVASGLRQAMTALGRDTSASLSQDEFRNLLVQSEIVSIAVDAGVDVYNLLEQSDIVFESLQQESPASQSQMSFEKFIDTILTMRESNHATVKDTSQNLRVISRMMRDTTNKAEDNLTKHIGSEVHHLEKELSTAMANMQQVVADAAKRSDDEYDDEDDEEEDDDEEAVAAPEGDPPMIPLDSLDSAGSVAYGSKSLADAPAFSLTRSTTY